MTKIPFNPKQQIIFVFFALSLLFVGCKSNTENSEQNSNESLPEEKNIVETVIIERQDFSREIISNGKLAAIEKAELYFKNPGIIGTIKVGNGEIDPTSTELVLYQPTSSF